MFSFHLLMSRLDYILNGNTFFCQNNDEKLFFFQMNQISFSLLETSAKVTKFVLIKTN